MIGDSVRAGLRRDGFTVDWVRDGRAADLALANAVYDLMLLDLGLPKKDGLDVPEDGAPCGQSNSGPDTHGSRLRR